MAHRLYLDTARLGLMRRGAQRLYGDFVRFAGEEGCSLYWEDFLRNGWKNWPNQLKRRYAHLDSWNGVAGLKESVRRLVGCRPESDVLLANRSALLMKLAARLMFRRCRNVLAPDLAWTGYEKWLRRERRRTDKRITLLPLRRGLLKDQMNATELVNLFREAFVRFGCDGLFLPAVDHWGIRLPVAKKLWINLCDDTGNRCMRFTDRRANLGRMLKTSSRNVFGRWCKVVCLDWSKASRSSGHG